MNWKSFFKQISLIIILAIIIFTIFVPVLIYNAQCTVPPCPVFTETILYVKYYPFGADGIDYNNLVLGAIISFLSSSLILLLVKLAIKKNKEKSISAAVILIGLFVFIFGLGCGFGYFRPFICRNDLTVLAILVSGLVVVGYGIYRFIKK